MTTASDILNALAGSLAAVAGDVARGLPVSSLTPPWARLALDVVESENGPELTSHQVRIGVDLWLCPATQSSDRVEREDQALLLASRATLAILNDGALRALVIAAPTVAFRTLEDSGAAGALYVAMRFEASYYLDNDSGGL